MAQLAGLVGEQSAHTIETILQGLNRPEAGIKGSLFGLLVLVLVIGATTVFGELRDAMDRIWQHRPAAACYAC